MAFPNRNAKKFRVVTCQLYASALANSAGGGINNSHTFLLGTVDFAARLEFAVPVIDATAGDEMTVTWAKKSSKIEEKPAP